MHALGADHEHNRPDRDSFVKVYMDNVDQNHKDDFLISTTNFKTYQTPYDFYSIMHYGWNSHAINKNRKTLEALITFSDNPLLETEKKDRLSPVDIVEMSRAYNCPVNPQTQVKYESYLEKLHEKLVDNVRICIEEMTTEDDLKCRRRIDTVEDLLDEFKSLAPQKYPALLGQKEQLQDRLAAKKDIFKVHKKVTQLEKAFVELCSMLSSGLMELQKVSSARMSAESIENYCKFILDKNL